MRWSDVQLGAIEIGYRSLNSVLFHRFLEDLVFIAFSLIDRVSSSIDLRFRLSVQLAFGEPFHDYQNSSLIFTPNWSGRPILDCLLGARCPRANITYPLFAIRSDSGIVSSTFDLSPRKHKLSSFISSSLSSKRKVDFPSSVQFTLWFYSSENDCLQNVKRSANVTKNSSCRQRRWSVVFIVCKDEFDQRMSSSGKDDGMLQDVTGIDSRV